MYIIPHNNRNGTKMRKKHSCMRTHNNQKRMRTIEDDFFLIGCILAAVLAACRLCLPGFRLPKLPPCLFHLVSGYYCPGCGGTRAVRALLSGHFIQSVYFHPAVPYGAVIYLYFMITQTIDRLSRGRLCIGMRYRNCYAWAAVLLIIGSFIIKNILHAFYGFSM